MNKQKKILFAPLDWGLGHATRCIPLIKECLFQGYEVVIAADEAALVLLSKEFPGLQFLHLQGYKVRYSSRKWLLPFSILSQVPKISSAIRNENRWLKKTIREHKIDLVISDNRYGLYCDFTPCIFVTHQLQIQVPQSVLMQKVLNKLNHYFIKKFTVCWVPDYEMQSMAGQLSFNKSKLNIRYIGNLSRFEGIKNLPKKYDFLILLSGPEPQRTLLEMQFLKQLQYNKKQVLLVRGKPGAEPLTSSLLNVEIKNHLHATELQQAILSAEIIFCRSGYSTIMDLIKLKRHAFLIPTPGQTEQEYLAAYLMQKKWFVSNPVSTNTFELHIKSMMQTFESFSFEDFPVWEMNDYKSAISSLSEYF